MSDFSVVNYFQIKEKDVFQLFGSVPIEVFKKAFKKQFTKRLIKKSIKSIEDSHISKSEFTIKVLSSVITTTGDMEDAFSRVEFIINLLEKIFGNQWNNNKELKQTFIENLEVCEDLVAFFLETIVADNAKRLILIDIWSDKLNERISGQIAQRLIYYSGNYIDYYDFFSSFLSFSHSDALKVSCSLYSVNLQELEALKETDYERFCDIHRYAGEIYSSTPSGIEILTRNPNLFIFQSELSGRKITKRGICPMALYVGNYLIAMGQFLQENKSTIFSIIEDAYENNYITEG